MSKTATKNALFLTWTNAISKKWKEQQTEDLSSAVAIMAHLLELNESEVNILLDEFIVYFKRNA